MCDFVSSCGRRSQFQRRLPDLAESIARPRCPKANPIYWWGLLHRNASLFLGPVGAEDELLASDVEKVEPWEVMRVLWQKR